MELSSCDIPVWGKIWFIMFSQYHTKFNFGCFPNIFRFLIITALRLVILQNFITYFKRIYEKSTIKCL